MPQQQNLAHHIDIAAGRLPVDTLIHGCNVVDVFSQELVPGPVALADGKIIAVGPHCKSYKASRYLDAKGGVVIPGLIDAHVHI